MSDEQSEHVAAVPCARCGHAIQARVEVMTPRLSVEDIAQRVVAIIGIETLAKRIADLVKGPRK